MADSLEAGESSLQSQMQKETTAKAEGALPVEERLFFLQNSIDEIQKAKINNPFALTDPVVAERLSGLQRTVNLLCVKEHQEVTFAPSGSLTETAEKVEKVEETPGKRLLSPSKSFYREYASSKDEKSPALKDPGNRSKIAMVVFYGLGKKQGGMSMSEIKNLLNEHPDLKSCQVTDSDMPKILNNTRGVLEFWIKEFKSLPWSSEYTNEIVEHARAGIVDPDKAPSPTPSTHSSGVQDESQAPSLSIPSFTPLQAQIAGFLRDQMRNNPFGQTLQVFHRHVKTHFRETANVTLADVRDTVSKMEDVDLQHAGTRSWARLKEHSGRPWCDEFLRHKPSQPSKPRIPSLLDEHVPIDPPARPFQPGPPPPAFWNTMAQQVLHPPSSQFGGTFPPRGPLQPPPAGPPVVGTSFGPPRDIGDANVQRDLQFKLHVFLENFPQGQPLLNCAHFLDREMHLSDKIDLARLFDIICAMGNIEVQNSGKQYWLKLKMFHSNGWNEAFIVEYQHSCADRVQSELASAVVKHTRNILSAATGKQIPAEDGPSTSKIAKFEDSHSGQAPGSTGSDMPPVDKSWSKQNQENVDSALQMIFYHAGMAEDGIMFSEIKDIFRDKMRYSLSRRELDRLKGKVCSGEENLEVTPDFSTDDLRITLQFG